MNDLIERYIYDVTRRLPEATRADVSKELKANINDMLPEKPTDEDIKKVIKELGEPRIMAAGYRQKPRYLVSPEWMDTYIQVLKIVLIIIGSITLISTLIDNILYPADSSIIGIIAEVFANVISEVIQSLFRGFAIVTIIFYCIEHCGSKVKKPEFNPDCLPQLPKENVNKISKVGSLIGLMVSIIMGVLFIFLMYKNQLYIGYWSSLDNGWESIVPLFNNSVVIAYIPFFILSLTISLLVIAIKLYYGHWNVFVAIAHTIEQVISPLISYLFLTKPNLISPTFITTIATEFSVEESIITNGISKGINGFFIFLVIVIGIDIISTWVKTLKLPSFEEQKHN